MGVFTCFSSLRGWFAFESRLDSGWACVEGSWVGVVGLVWRAFSFGVRILARWALMDRWSAGRVGRGCGRGCVGAVRGGGVWRRAGRILRG